MTDGITGALIGAGATLIAAISPFVYKHFTNKKIVSNWDFLIGIWYGIWKEELNGSEEIRDTIEFQKIKGTKIIGVGDVPQYGKYLINGELNFFTILFTFKGENSTHDYAGVFLIAFTTTKKSELNGKWLQLRNEKIVSGTVKLVRRT